MFTEAMIPPLFYVGALVLSALAGIALALLLLLKAAPVPGARLLALFLAGVAIWSGGQALPPLFGPVSDGAVGTLLALAPLPSAVFVHLVLAFVRCGATGPLVGVAYGLAVAATILGMVVDPGQVVAWRGFRGVFIPSTAGWVVIGVCGLLSVAGHLRLFKGWLDLTGLRRRQAAAICCSSLIGLISLTGFAFPPLGIDAYPWPVLGLPFYSVALVYGILRYQLMDVNLWVRRMLVWLLLMGLMAAAATLVMAWPLAAGTPFAGLETWLLMMGMTFIMLAILKPLRFIADRLVFPGGEVSAADLKRWREDLAVPADWPALLDRASALIGLRLGLPVNVRLEAAEGPMPALVLSRDVRGWCCHLVGWDDAPPGPRYAAGLFASCLAEAAARLDRAEVLARAERERQQEARLAELGQLAATVAHDLRNPLNIITMAATGAPLEVRTEIAEQVNRMEMLVRDVMDYAGTARLELSPLLVADAVALAMSGLPGLRVETDIDPELSIRADSRRLRQVLVNLLENAAAHGQRLAVMAEEVGDAVRIHICDDGPGVPTDIRDRLFQPFVSRRPSGTGLGLAIVARIMEAHGGTVALGNRSGWSTCLTLTFPDRMENRI
ncbi:sensor histidine kinase [Niveispirillum irakense]|uniref:sensor histidine kinase n=1 Tax=Niveispirillum irakense TaxID=34011 RepID=UPI00042526C5|nr:sensor histidine kinase [Niveispirillum irakense]